MLHQRQSSLRVKLQLFFHGLQTIIHSAGAVAASSHFAGKEDDFGDLGYLVNFLSTVILFLLISGDIRQKQLLPRWSFAPRLLVWVMVLLIPVGAVLEGINERLLEVPLLVFAGVWMMVGLAALTPRRDV